MWGENTLNVENNKIISQFLKFNGVLLAFLAFLLIVSPVNKLKNIWFGFSQQQETGSVYIYGDKTLEQTFSLVRTADSVDLKVYCANNSLHGKFSVSISEANNQIYAQTIYKTDIQNSTVAITMKNTPFYAGKEYTIHIEARDLKKQDAIRVATSTYIGGKEFCDYDQLKYADDIRDDHLLLSIYNSIFNYFALLAIAVLFITANIWWFNRYKPVERYALWILIGAGLIMFFIMAPSSGPDDEYHYYSAFEVSNAIMGKENLCEVEEKYRDDYQTHYNSNYNFIKTLKGIKGISTEEIEGTFDYDGFKNTLLMPASHLAPAIGFTIARILGLNMVQLYILGRLANLLMYIVLCYIAIRIVPQKKELMLLIAILPMALHQAVQLSYDTIINGLSLIFIAYILRLIITDRKVTWNDVCICTIILVILGVIKYIYFISVLLILAIPKTHYKNTKDRILKTFFLLVIVPGIIICINIQSLIPALTSNHKRVITDYYTISSVFSQPLRFIRVVLHTLRDDIGAYYRGAIGKYFAGLTVESPEYLSFAYSCILIVLAFCRNEKNNIGLSFQQRVVFILTMCTGVILTICACATFTSYGAGKIAGIQGRYFIPFVCLLFYGLSSKRIRVQIQERFLIYPIWFIELGYIVSVMSQIQF